ncbi:penicillin-binding protein 1A [Oleiagrimonas sp. C23AA]|uniref:penicillin-binding protein 1A n=1 Tax=Oleiagrimonas sp. C23AA TaxID=2719047 RepID=UPI00141F9E65|nr:penicillin-binding protein 1A [Oleiagrimonas sp. C23AA]NII09810.1 penicillin-binding protein 1A [Oleiagrimonas sp. C23AA]
MRILKRLLRYALILALAGIVLGAAALGVAYWLIAPRLPSVDSLKDVRMQVPLRVLSKDGKLIASFGEMRRIPIKIENVPARLKNAVLSAEDADFYHHSGIDVEGTLRAAVHVVLAGGRKVQGGSTITQQVARNFFLSPQKSYTRKLTEIFLSFRIENELSKDQILQLYLNKMFMGHRAYGVAAAAQVYYGKTLDQLTIAECAMLGSLYQAPSVVNPITSPKRAIDRRNWVLGQMLSHHFINQQQYKQAIAEPDHASLHEPPVQVHAPYVAEMVRQAALDRLGNVALTDGYVIHTTIEGDLQGDANHALRQGLIDYDHRHGYRGPEAHVQLPPQVTDDQLDHDLDSYNSVAGLLPGIVTDADAKKATVYLGDSKTITLDMDAVAWARPYVNANYPGARPKAVDAVIKRGDVVRVTQVTTKHDSKTKDDNVASTSETKKQWQLAQIPAAQSALVSLDPDTGAVRALVGGFSFLRSKFNRALMTGSGRQPGSSFKPYLYSAALQHGYTPASIINDAPVVLPDPSKPNGVWTPSNDDGKFDGPMRLRTALVESKNLVSVRLLDALGLPYARHYIIRFGFSLSQLPDNLSMALGTASVSPMSMARGYSVFANGGYLITPYFISEIDDRNGTPVYKADPQRACRQCQQRLLQDPTDVDTDPLASAASSAAPATAGTVAASNAPQAPATAPVNAASVAGATDEHADDKPRLAPRVLTPRNDFLITSLMKDVIRKGTGHAAMALGRTDLAGKTGTTNDHRDGWFGGFNTDLVTVVWVGFDDFSILGRGEFGAETALPIWMDYMGAALKGKPPAELPMPPGITTLTINKHSGLPTSVDDPDAMKEYFKVEDVDRLRAKAKQQQETKEQQHAYDIF